MTASKNTSGSVILPQWLKEYTMKKHQKFIADDGREFETAAECKAYEARESIIKTIMNADEVALAAAMDGDVTYKDVAEALEAAGTACAKARRASGDVKKRGRKAAE